MATFNAAMKYLCIILVSGVVLAGTAGAQVPAKINYQGRLVDQDTGLPLSGTYEIVFRIFDVETEGAALWEETQSVTPDAEGVFSAILGSMEEIGIGFVGAVWLEIEVGGEVLAPRREIVSVPFAFRSKASDGAGDADSLGGYAAGTYIMEGETGVIAADMIVDGPGSGLDGDMLDGLDSDAFADSGHTHDDRYYLQTELSTPGAINDGGNPVDWTKLKNVPPDFADGSDDAGGTGDGHSLDASDGDPVDVVFVAADGNVGIGTTIPAKKVDINGDLRLRYNKAISFGDDNTRLYQSGVDLYARSADDIHIRPDGDLYVGSASGDWAVFDNGKHRLGIGVTSPSQALEVAGCAKITATSGAPIFINASGQSLIQFENPGVGPMGFMLKNSLRRWLLMNGAGMLDRFSLVDATSSRYVVSIDGPTDNIGIWTDDPDTGSVVTIDAQQRFVGLHVSNASAGAILAEHHGPNPGGAVIASNFGDWGASGVEASAHGGFAALEARADEGADYAVYASAEDGAEAGYFDGEVTITNDLTTSVRAFTVFDEPSSVAFQSVNLEATPSSPKAYHDILQIIAPETAPDGFQFIECQRYTDIEFQVNGNGDVKADGTFSPGGADMAEMIAVADGAATVGPGDVMVIDPGSTRAVVVSASPRSRLVAGIYSTKPGFIGSERDWDKPAAKGEEEGGAYTLLEVASEFDEIPMAVVGIAPCKVSAENGPVRPGDLLVTSTTPGHAMRDDDPGVGTVLGKALEHLDSGTGKIRVLVTLQ